MKTPFYGAGARITLAAVDAIEALYDACTRLTPTGLVAITATMTAFYTYVAMTTPMGTEWLLCAIIHAIATAIMVPLWILDLVCRTWSTQHLDPVQTGDNDV